MEIAIIGAGNVGAALATAWKRAGHSIILGLRDAGKHSELIKTTGARALSPADAAQEAEVIVLALPYPAVEPVVSELGPLAGKILIDATPFMGSPVSGGRVTVTDHPPSPCSPRHRARMWRLTMTGRLQCCGRKTPPPGST